MAQTMYAHMNKWIKKNIKNKKITDIVLYRFLIL
jgi:hypothetical protein